MPAALRPSALRPSALRTSARRIPARQAAVSTAAGVLLAGLGTSAAAAPAVSAPMTGTTASAPASAASQRPTAADRLAGRVASGWLARQFVDGTHLTTDFGGTSYDDPGLTLDAVLAFAATKTNNAHARRAVTWISAPDTLAGYLGDGTTESYAGAHAKLVLALQVRSKNPSSFGGRNVLGELRSLMRADGRLSDRSKYGDFSNAFGQSFGVIALERAGAGAATRAAGYLAGQACADGGVPITFEQPSCAGDADATALAIQAFHATGRTAAARKAASWLTTHATIGGAGNTNTAGLAAAALDLVGGSQNAQVADRARDFVRARQQGCAAPFARRGAIAFDRSGFNAATAPRATTQAVLGLAGANLGTLTSAGSISYAPTLSCP